ncbi:DNA-binding transcriptional response regulator, NtrC family, contains REC, AAA-type ATPase, and a Fis-type DNA-binding domains [Nitrosomonas cryotolerans]|uniref:Two component, sigma54 specific, transcriptional regulator, Fis family n=1 Tax=Nitrosomonas cryotolerans ATCC 49181 TaxID=1131553 RepID=A0A1N6GYP7_9PROT|nr:sigma-54 dependent transcriptional regulator [Nitrosomonas cryotolerans]SFP87733.1 DNA-binding transcriptional response regulator, NtrC family, contains REC, AAA-type ATPase, and a Fis-type DNA-binding domains [Nitrosomonas cryotolerans]SIO12688.1 two component, sigma54 specific, transcriptional regulator, Fis family [Nitrosomonas cryotolerans ATCC 49181]
MSNNTILIVDDEIGIRELLSEILHDEGYRVALAENAEQARIWRSQTRPDLVLLDIWMPDTDGITLLKDWASSGMLTMPVIMMSGHGTIDTAVEATRIGAFGYLEKPIPLQKLLSTVGKALRGSQSKRPSILSLASLGRGALIADLKKRLEQVANLKAPLLLTGEPGVGVELCARFMHRPNTPWIEPETLGLLTEAPLDLLEQARDGLLFLKDIGEINRLGQKGLLLLLSKLEKYNVRLVCATSLPLAELTAQGVYNVKLYEILSNLSISIPALRAHREDIPELANQILSRFVESGETSSLLQLSTAALNCLRNYDWPGNLTQLTGVVRSLALTCVGDEISAESVQQALAFPKSTSMPTMSDTPLNLSLREARDLFEKAYFEKLIDQESGNMTRVAERAGLERTHLYRKIKLLGIKLRGH